MLRSFTNQSNDNWDQFVSLIEFAYNDTISATTKLTPFQVDTGQHPIRSVISTTEFSNPLAQKHIDNIKTYNKIAKDAIQKAQQYQAEYYNRNKRSISIKGDLVLVHKSALTFNVPKLLPIYFGPYKVLKKIHNSFKLKIPKDSKMNPIIHSSYLKYFNNPITERPVRPYGVKQVSNNQPQQIRNYQQ